jgi:hypothetical protein
MRRIPEPELMDDEEQAAIYAGADFSEAPEIAAQLKASGLGYLVVREAGDRHVVISGYMEGGG